MITNVHLLTTKATVSAHLNTVGAEPFVSVSFNMDNTSFLSLFLSVEQAKDLRKELEKAK